MKQEFHSDETGNEGFKVEKKLKREVRPNQKEEKLQSNTQCHVQSDMERNGERVATKLPF